MAKASKIKIDFTREGKRYNTNCSVTRENSGNTYKLDAEVKNSKGKTIFTKERTGLDYSQVEPALIFVFHQAFVEN